VTISNQEDLSFLLKSPVTLNYDRKGKQTQPAQKALRECRKVLLKLLPYDETGEVAALYEQALLRGL
jgi:hypothetical protein